MPPGVTVGVGGIVVEVGLLDEVVRLMAGWVVVGALLRLFMVTALAAAAVLSWSEAKSRDCVSLEVDVSWVRGSVAVVEPEDDDVEALAFAALRTGVPSEMERGP